MRIRHTILAAVAIATLTGLAAAQEPVIVVDPAEANQLMQEGRFAEAADAFRLLLIETPDAPRVQFLYAYCLHGAGRLGEAIPAHRKAAEHPQFAAIATYNLGCAYALLDQRDEAFAALNRAVELGPLRVEQWEGDADLKSLHADPRWEALLEHVRTIAANPPDQALRFWIGEWDVYDPRGKKAGENSITLRDNGRVIYEAWTSAGGGGGESFNYWEPVGRQWKQVWVDGTGNVLEMAGTFRDGALRFLGTEFHRDGTTAHHRTTLTPLDGGRVRQFIENSSDGGLTWNTAYDFTYVPKGAPLERTTTAPAG